MPEIFYDHRGINFLKTFRRLTFNYKLADLFLRRLTKKRHEEKKHGIEKLIDLAYKVIQNADIAEMQKFRTF